MVDTLECLSAEFVNVLEASKRLAAIFADRAPENMTDYTRDFAGGLAALEDNLKGMCNMAKVEYYGEEGYSSSEEESDTTEEEEEGESSTAEEEGA